MIKNMKLEISYDGTDFHGFQVQPKHRTVQGTLEQALQKLTGKETKVFASGRTDAGVHARKQVCNFHTDSRIPIEKWPVAINTLLPEDLVVYSAVEVAEGFHSRYDVERKTYRYTIYNDKYVDLFRRRFVWHYPYTLNIESMQLASQYFLGEHDFTSFSSSKTNIESKVRTIYEFQLRQEGKEIIIQVTGNGFLYNMVRIMVGTLTEIGRGKLEPVYIQKLLKKKERPPSRLTAPANGLTLWDVEY